MKKAKTKTNLEPFEKEFAQEKAAGGSPSVAKWFAKKFPKLPKEFGDAVLEELNKQGKQVVCDISQPFLAATLGESAVPRYPDDLPFR